MSKDSGRPHIISLVKTTKARLTKIIAYGIPPFFHPKQHGMKKTEGSHALALVFHHL